MSASPFRSHLLQQWARGNQGRAPVAVVPWLTQNRSTSHEIDDEEKKNHQNCRCGHCLSISTIQSTVSNKPSTLSSSSQTESPTRSTARYFSTTAVTTSKKSYPRQEHSERIKPRSSNIKKYVHNTSIGSDDWTEDELDEDLVSKQASAFQSILLTRRTATRLKAVEDSDPENQQQMLMMALDRAVKCAQMAPNHKHTEPFSFKRFLAGSTSAQQLADIAYHVTLQKTGSHPNAESKRQKWLDIPGYLVTLLHENHSGFEEKDLVGDPYKALPYVAPETERQLEDYAAACAAVQNVLLSLHSEGIGSKWATGPVIETPAFRRLVHASSTDRIVGLIMVGGSTKFDTEREEQITAARRRRRRPINDDLMVDLP